LKIEGRVSPYFIKITSKAMLLHKELTDQILNVFYEVYNELGYGFLEKVYQNAMYYELKDRGFEVVTQKRLPVQYKGREVGEYFSDIIVNDVVILELKACASISEEHELQLLNYLKASSIEIGFVLNFGKDPEFSRKIFSNERKNLHKRKNP
jgi:GxxExxY protein